MITWDEWHTCPPEYFQYRFEGFSKLENTRMKREWEIGRFIAFFSCAGFLKPEVLAKGEQAWRPFSWERKLVPLQKSVQEIINENRELFDKLTPVTKEEQLPAQVAIDGMNKIAQSMQHR